MEKVFPLMSVSGNVIVSKRGDVTFGWDVGLPTAFSLSAEDYDSLVHSFVSATRTLPPWTVIHKQDLFLKKSYRPKEASSFLGACFETHFAGRGYLSHSCRIFLTFSSKSTVTGSTSSITGAWTAPHMPDARSIARFRTVADTFAGIISSNPLVSMEPLSESGLMDRATGRGAISDYLFLGQESLSDILAAEDSVTVGRKSLSCYMVNRSSQFTGTDVESTVRLESLSSASSEVRLSSGAALGISLRREHCLNQYILVLDQQEYHRKLEKKRREMMSLSIGSKENDINARQIGDLQEEVHMKGHIMVGSHMNLLIWDEDGADGDAHNEVMAAFAGLGVQAVRNTCDAPCVFLAGCPGAATETDPEDWIPMELSSALCLWPMESFETGVRGGTISLCDRHRMIPLKVDIHENARARGWISNLNAFLFGPSGSGKSFLMNKILLDCYDHGADIFVMDVGDSYEGLCSVIREGSGSRDGRYFSYDPAHPLSFNPFRGCRTWTDGSDDGGRSFMISLLQNIWQPLDGGVRRWAQHSTNILENTIETFIREWSDREDPVFDDYYRYLSGTVVPAAESGRFVCDGIAMGLEMFNFKEFCIAIRDFAAGGRFGYLLNSREEKDIFSGRFSVFEVDEVSHIREVYPLWLLCIMHTFEMKMRSSRSFKLIVIDEAWKAIANEHMAPYIDWLWRTARKFNTGAVVVTQQLDDIVSSDIIRNSIINNSDVKIILDQSRNRNNFDWVMSLLGLVPHDRDLILSVGQDKDPRYTYKEAFIGYALHPSAVYAYEVSEEEAAVFESDKVRKAPLMSRMREVGPESAIREFVSRDNNRKQSERK